VNALILAVVTLAPTALAAAEFPSTCTESTVTVNRTAEIPLLSAIGDPVLSMTQVDTTVVLGRSEATRLLKQRMRWLDGHRDPVSSAPLAQATETILRVVANIADAEAPVAAEGLYPPLDGASAEIQRANILVQIEYRFLFRDALLEGAASVNLDGRHVKRATASWYTAHDELGVVSGVRVGLGRVTFLDVCSTDPH
jgi:hypothetical protein